VRRKSPSARIEVLTPDFQGRARDLEIVLKAGRMFFNHNMETVRRLQREIRPAAGYDRSLDVLRCAAACHRGFLSIRADGRVGRDRQRDSRNAGRFAPSGCELVSIGQYLAPSAAHRPVDRYASPAQFERYAREARGWAFAGSPPVHW